jgi:hypothetical protein
MGLEYVENPSWRIQLIFSLFTSCIFAFAGFALSTEKLLPSKYYKIKDLIKLKFWFAKLKEEWFRKFLLVTV